MGAPSEIRRSAWSRSRGFSPRRSALFRVHHEQPVERGTAMSRVKIQLRIWNTYHDFARHELLLVQRGIIGRILKVENPAA
jgi:hypothetical protein